MKQFDLSEKHTIKVPQTARLLQFEATENDLKKQSLESRLEEIDLLTTKSRTLRGMLMGCPDTIAYVEMLEAEAERIRTELAGLRTDD